MSEDDFEDISQAEADRVLATLDDLINSVESTNIKHHLIESFNNVFELIFGDQEDDFLDAEAA